MPKIIFWLSGFIGIAQLIGLLVLFIPRDSNDDQIVVFDHASRCMENTSASSLDSNGVAAILNQPSKSLEQCWQAATLPENNPIQEAKVDLHHPKLVRTWYRIHYRVPVDWNTSKPLMIFVPRVIANAWQINLEGQHLTDNRFEWRSTWNRPVSATFFANNFQLGRTIEIDLGVIASLSEGHSVARIFVGDAVVLRGKKAFREYFQVIMPQALSAVMLMLGLFFLTFWLARRPETEYLYLAFACLAYSVLNLRYIVSQPDNPTLDIWYNALIIDSPIPWINCLDYLFIARFAKFSYLWVEKLVWLQVIVISLITFSPISLNYDLSLIKGIVSFISGILGIVIIIWQTIVRQNIPLAIIAIMTSVGIFIGIHDIILSLNLINPEEIYLGPYSMLALFASFIYVIQRRYSAAITSQEHLNVDLAKQLVEREVLTLRLTESEAELRAQQNRLLALERSQTLSEERQRLMHDMHDGLGSSLLTTLAAIEKDNMPQEAVADALRACIEDLRLVIDSLEPVAHDLVTLLATIRYRLGQRLDAAGLELRWEIDDLPPLPWLEPPDALNVLRLVQEALVNVLKHANASYVRVTTRDLGKLVEIQIQDNGCGFDKNTVTPGRGMHSQANRAERLGGKLEVESTPGHGTLLRLLLPVRNYPRP